MGGRFLEIYLVDHHAGSTAGLELAKRAARSNRGTPTGDALVELREWDAVRVPPRTWRGYEAGPEGLEILVIGAPNLGENPREDVDGRRDWWAEEPLAQWARSG
jgi:hypothetical protein